MKISDVIAEFINGYLEEENEVELRRTELASRFNCAPSQINYVIETRFSPEMGFFVESRRGGGGYIRITRASLSADAVKLHAINSIGDEIDKQTASAIIRNLFNIGALEEQTANAIIAIMGDKALGGAPQEIRGKLRAGILKTAIMTTAV